MMGNSKEDWTTYVSGQTGKSFFQVGDRFSLRRIRIISMVISRKAGAAKVWFHGSHNGFW